MNKATAASMVTENIGGWPRHIDRYLDAQGFGAIELLTENQINAYVFDDGSVIHEDFELSFPDEDAWYEWAHAQEHENTGHFAACHDRCVC